MEADDHVAAAVAQIQRMGMTLDAEADNAADFPAQRVEFDLLVAKNSHGAATMPAGGAKFN
jgi:hypothetical protein